MAAVGTITVLVIVIALLARPPAVLQGKPELLVAAPAAAVVLVAGWEPWSAVADQVRELAPTLLFLVGVLLIAASCEAAGLFDVVGDRLAAQAAHGDRRLVVGCGLVAFAVTSVLSLDATVVLFTPVVIRLVRTRRAAAAPALLVTVLIANAGSLALPVANLTNLLVLERTGIGYGTFVEHILLPALASTAVVIAVCARRTPEGAQAATVAEPASATAIDPVGIVVGAVTLLALVGFFVAAALGPSPAWVALPVGCALGVLVLATGRTSTRTMARRSGVDFVAFVVALAVVVDAAARHGLDEVARWTPHGTDLLALIGVVLLATALANLMNNLPATLLLLPVLAHRPVAVALAALIGLNIGPNLSYPGSLATLLWRRVTAGAGAEPSRRAFYGAAWASTPLALASAVFLLWVLQP